MKGGRSFFNGTGIIMCMHYYIIIFHVQSYAAEITETPKISTGAEKLAELCSTDDRLTKNSEMLIKYNGHE